MLSTTVIEPSRETFVKPAHETVESNVQGADHGHDASRATTWGKAPRLHEPPPTTFKLNFPTSIPDEWLAIVAVTVIADGPIPVAVKANLQPGPNPEEAMTITRGHANL